MKRLLTNPFTVKTPETMTAGEVVELFVPIGEYFDIAGPGHVFVHGNRGCGKSMMFRLMSPDCQILRRQTELHSLPYYGIYLSIKATDLNIPEFHRLDGQLAGFVLSEHILVGYLVVKTLQSLLDTLNPHVDDSIKLRELKGWSKSIVDRLTAIGWKDQTEETYDRATTHEYLLQIIEVFNSFHVQTLNYLRRLTFIKDIMPFQGPLLGFHDFLLPILKDLKQLSFMPRGPIYLLIDDADNLNFQQTQVLNTWVSYRTTAELSLKISTQLNYKTFLTTGSHRIESPHDYSEIHVSSTYTGPAKDKYPQWVEDIVEKRLKLFDIATTSRDFFPPDEEQEKQIALIAKEYKERWETQGTGYRPGDDAYRYARPEYIRRLLGTTKQGYRYKYAGFDQLVHISSGIIRFFLEPASQMFAEEENNLGEGKVEFITASVQDKVLREMSDQIMLVDFDKLISDIDQSFDAKPESVQRMEKLRNLIHTLGGMFQQILVSDYSERRVFSFAISDEPDREVREILKLGVQYGYFYESSIGTKEGMGRTKLFVLTRRLAPFFKLDPTGFSGYKFVTNSFLRSALVKPKTTQNLMKQLGVDAVISQRQQAFEFHEETR